jgi:DNA-binding transcriptional LysR family regulator
MDTRQLRSFIAVADHLNFTKAAKSLHLAQPSLSRQIAELEKELGVTLFTRTNRIVTITPAGNLLLNEAESLISRIDKLIEQTRYANAGIIGNLSIGCLGLEKIFFAKLVRSFRSGHLDINININWITTMASLTRALLQGHIDIGFTLESEVQKNPKLAWRPVYSDPLAVVMPIDHPLAGESTIKLAQLTNESFVFISQSETPGSLEKAIQLCISKGFSPRIVNQPSSLEGLFLLVESGIGITLISRQMQAFTSPDLRFIKLEDDDALVTVVIAWNKTNKNPVIPFFCQELENILNPCK